jgi:AcrR family transcriptional regulator
LINRYFGSKEKLFSEVCADAMASPMVLAEDSRAADDMALHMAKALVDITGKGATPMDGFLILLHSASNKTAARIGRAEIEKHHAKILAGALDGELVPQRAALMLGLVAGFQVMRQMIGLSSLTKAKSADLVKLLTPLIRQLIVVGKPPKVIAKGKKR